MAISSLLLAPFAALGIAGAALAAALASPVAPPPTLASIHRGASAIDQAGMPELSRFQARDGTWLAYRLYPAASGAKDRIAILAHGSSASSSEMHVVARTLADNGVTAVAIDARGHGASGERGDIAYVGQLDDDLADLIADLGKSYPAAKWELIGHSSGGGFVMRVAAGPLGQMFERFVLLAPYLGYRAPTNRPAEGAGLWASPDYPRIIALTLLDRLGVDWAQSLPTLAFANPPESRMKVTSQYSFRLMTNYATPYEWQAPFNAAKGKVLLIAGADDELMDAPAYERYLAPLGVKVTLLPGVDHMGVVHQPAALAAIVAAAK